MLSLSKVWGSLNDIAVPATQTTMPNDARAVASAVSRVAASLLQADLGIISAARRRRKLLRVFGSSSRVAVALLSPPCVDPCVKIGIKFWTPRLRAIE